MSMFNKFSSPLFEGEVELLNQTRALKPSPPPKPWGNKVIISASGVIAAGWDKFEKILLISTDGYSLNDPLTGAKVIRNQDSELTFASIMPDYLRFRVPDSQEIVTIFGINGGDGIHRTEDGWTLKHAYPWWPRESVLIKSPFVPGSGRHGLLDDAYMIELERLTGWLKCGFSLSGKYFIIVGSAGVESFSR